MSNVSNVEQVVPEINLDTVKARSVKGVVALTGRLFVMNIMSFVAIALLGAFLTPTEWGIFALVTAIVDFLVYFSDIGLAASLIQKKEQVTDNDLKTTFTTQQFLIIGLLALLVLFSRKIEQGFNLSGDGVVLMYALGLSLFLSSLRTIPTVLLERKIEFHKIAFVNIVENAIYYAILVFAAWKGLGIKSYTFAVLARSIVGLFVMYYLSPWRPILGFSTHSFKNLLKFGIPYQANTLIALAKDRGIVLVLGRLLGLDALGLIDWAKKWSQMPLRVVSDSVTKVTFPAFARMQEDRDHLSRSVTRSIFFITFLSFPAIVGLVILAPILISIVPQYEKWKPALVLLTLLSVNALIGSFTTQLTNLLNAIGKIRITFYLMIMWTVLTWVFVPFFAIRYGVVGAALGFALVEISSIVPLYIVRNYVKFSVKDSLAKPFYATFIMAVVLLVLRSALPYNFYSLSILVIVGVCVYGVTIVTFIGQSLYQDARRAFGTLLRR